MGDKDSQGKIYRRILKGNARSLPAQLGLTSSYLRSGQLDDAIAEYRLMLRVPKVRLLLAQLLMMHQAGRTADAEKLHAEPYQHSRDLKEPEIIAECYAALADLYLRTKRFKEAAPFLRRLSELGHVSAADANWGRRHLAIVLASHGDFASFKQALNLTHAKSKLHGEAPDDRP